MKLADELRYDSDGLLPVVLQDHETLEVLILAFMNREALERTLSSGLVHLWSRSRGELWLKGESSGRTQRVVEVRPNCELNSLLILVRQDLPGACHTGHSSCYYRRLTETGLEEIQPVLFDPADVYRTADVDPVQELLAAYAWLRDQPLIPASGTSRTLHASGPDPLERAFEEWDELLGVLEGTHAHEGFEHDSRLEAYQALYWTCLYQVLADPAYAGTVEQLSRGYGGREHPRVYLRAARAAGDTAARLDALWMALGSACRLAGLDPAEVATRDLSELRSRPYMSGYFGSDVSASE